MADCKQKGTHSCNPRPLVFNKLFLQIPTSQFWMLCPEKYPGQPAHSPGYGAKIRADLW
jgi:hypothetical protein